MPLPPVGPTILSTIILTSLFFPGWKYPIFVHCTRPWRLILHMVRVSGFLPRMGSLSTKTVILRYVYGCGRKAGGNLGPPQIVLGANDALNNSWTEGSKIEMSSATANGFYSRYYLAVTKHLSMKEVGEWGLHLAYVYNRRKDYPLNGPAIGANFRFSLSPDFLYQQSDK